MRMPAQWFGIFICMASATFATTGYAQFEEPDTVPSWAIGPYIEATFRGAKGTIEGTRKLDWSNGAVFGLRGERRVGRTATLALSGNYGRTKEKFKTGGGSESSTTGGSISVVNLVGELLFKVKPQVPGYFIFGAGARFVSPDSDDSFFGREDSYVEPLGVVGLGVEALSRRRGALNVYLRFYIAATTEQPLQSTNSLSTDFAIGLNYLFRL